MRYVMVKVTRSEAAERVSEFRPWEVPILQLIHGDELVHVVGEVDYDKIPYPDAQAEYERMETKYRAPEGSDASYCRQVYGIGAARLHKAIQEAEQEASERDPIAFEPAPVLDIGNKGYLKAEAASIAKEREAIKAERAALEAEKAEKVAAEGDALAAERAQIAAERAQIAAERAAVAKEREEVASLLDAATAAPAAKPAAKKPSGKAEPAAQPISE